MRLDVFLFENGYFKSRQKAKYAIEDSLVLINSKVVNKLSYDVKETDIINILPSLESYVSRGGFKLSKALKEFNIDCTNKLCLDIGASTGGFTDCLIQNNASLVYAIDVGTNQLDESLKNNPKIISIENVNFKDIKESNLNNNKFDIITIDVSFISLKHIINNAKKFLKDDGLIICLIKPQFELYEKAIKNKGLIKNKNDHYQAIINVLMNAKENNLLVSNLTYSPIVGEKKENIEFLACLNTQISNDINVKEIIDEAYKNFGRK